MFRHTWRLAELIVFVSGLSSAAAEGAEAYRITAPSVQVVCELTVGGTFEARTKALAGQLSTDPGITGALGGSVTVDLRTFKTGIGLRDTHLRERYLEVGKSANYATATLSDIQLEGWDPRNVPVKTRFRATLTLHGQEKSVIGIAEIGRSADGLKLQASLPINVTTFGIERPAYFGVGVKDEVLVKVAFRAVAVGSSVGAATRPERSTQIASSRPRAQ